MDSWERFDETLFPDKEAFYSNLNMEDILDVDYMRANRVFKNLSNENLGDYHDLYVQSDTICHAMHRYAKANHKYMKNYNKHEEESFLEYLDDNNLYGWAMSKKLPVNGFRWKKDMLKFNEEFIRNYEEDSDKGYILEVDVEYPKHLQFSYDLPFLPEKIKINKIEKLICNLSNKEKLFCHIRLLRQVLNHGLILKKVNRVIQFNQEAWLKSNIDMNTELIKKAKNDFEKDLMNNAVFGKTMENVRKHRHIKLVTTDKKRNQLVPDLIII